MRAAKAAWLGSIEQKQRDADEARGRAAKKEAAAVVASLAQAVAASAAAASEHAPKRQRSDPGPAVVHVGVQPPEPTREQISWGATSLRAALSE